MKRLTIYDIKRAVDSTGSFFFSKNNMKFAGQKMKDFKVYKVDAENYFITAPCRLRDMVVGRLEAYYNTETKKITSHNNRIFNS